MAASQSLSRLKAKRYRGSHRQTLKAIQSLILAVESIQPSKRLPADYLSQLRTVLRKTIQRARHVERLNARRSASARAIQTQRSQGLRLAQTRDVNAVLGWLLNRQAHASKGLYAMAMGKRTAAKLGRDHYKDIGRKGAQSRWNPELTQYLAMWSVGTVFPD